MLIMYLNISRMLISVAQGDVYYNIERGLGRFWSVARGDIIYPFEP